MSYDDNTLSDNDMILGGVKDVDGLGVKRKRIDTERSGVVADYYGVD